MINDLAGFVFIALLLADPFTRPTVTWSMAALLMLWSADNFAIWMQTSSAGCGFAACLFGLMAVGVAAIRVLPLLRKLVVRVQRGLARRGVAALPDSMIVPNWATGGPGTE